MAIRQTLDCPECGRATYQTSTDGGETWTTHCDHPRVPSWFRLVRMILWAAVVSIIVLSLSGR